MGLGEGLLSVGSCAEPDKSAEERSLARAVDMVVQMTEFIRGSRVDDYGPLLALAARLCTLASMPSAAAIPQQTVGRVNKGSPGEALPRSVSGSALRLVGAIVSGHSKEVGASAGLATVTQAAPAWVPLLSHAPIGEVSMVSSSYSGASPV
jgi:hypothetical protein